MVHLGSCSFPGKVQWKEPSWAKIVREEVSQAKDWTSHLSDFESVKTVRPPARFWQAGTAAAPPAA